MPFGLKTFGAVVGFTVIETVTLQVWLILAQLAFVKVLEKALGVDLDIGFVGLLVHPLNLLSAVILFAGLLYEHIRAAKAGKAEGA